MSSEEMIFVGDFEPAHPDSLIHDEAVDPRYLGSVDDGRFTIVDEQNPAKAWISSTVSLTPREYRELEGGV